MNRIQQIAATLIFGATVAGALLTTSCRTEPAEVRIARYGSTLNSALPPGTPRNDVEAFFTTNNMPVVFEPMTELISIYTLQVEPEEEQFTNCIGRYHSILHDAGPSSFGPYSIRIYVYVDRTGRVVTNRVRGIFTGP